MLQIQRGSLSAFADTAWGGWTIIGKPVDGDFQVIGHVHTWLILRGGEITDRALEARVARFIAMQIPLTEMV